MPECRIHRAAQILFVTVLALGLTALLVTFRLVPGKFYTNRRPLDDGVSAPPGNASARVGYVLARTTMAVAQADSDAARPHRNNVSRGGNSTERDVLRTPHQKPVAVHDSSDLRAARFPAPDDSSALEVTVSLLGMLGNNMFQYASLLGIAHMNGRRPFCGTSSGLHRFFEVTHIRDRPGTEFVGVDERHFASYDPTFEHLPNKSVIVTQYLQSWKYFDVIRDTIKQEFRFKQHLNDQAARLLAKFDSKVGQKVKVGVHVRRGDMVSVSSQRRGYHVAPASYIIKAMDYMRQKHGDVIFVVVTQDVSWCLGALQTRSDYVIADSAAGEVHLALLASCDHVIMTVGTYGWWGGYLSGGEVVYYWDPKESLHQPPLPVEIRHPEDFFPPSWVQIAG